MPTRRQARAYNQRLSAHRADGVVAELVRDGVPRYAISIQGFERNHVLVPTSLEYASRRVVVWRSSSVGLAFPRARWGRGAARDGVAEPSHGCKNVAPLLLWLCAGC